MACTITQDDLGPQFADAVAEIVAMYIEDATIEVLGPSACQAEKYIAWLACCLDPCLAIRRLAQHMIASDADSGAGSGDVTSEAVGDVSASYATATTSSGAYGATPWGRSYAGMIAKFEVCRARRQFTGISVLGGCGC